MSDYETATILGFRWWQADELLETTDSVFPPTLGQFLARLVGEGPPREPVDITDRSAS